MKCESCGESRKGTATSESPSGRYLCMPCARRKIFDAIFNMKIEVQTKLD